MEMEKVMFSKDASTVEVVAYSWGKYLIENGESFLFFSHNSTPQDLGRCVFTVAPEKGALIIPASMYEEVEEALWEESASRDDQPILQDLLSRLGY